MGAKGAKMKTKWGPRVAEVHQNDPQATNMGSPGRQNGGNMGATSVSRLHHGPVQVTKLKKIKAATSFLPKMVPQGRPGVPKWSQN